jgi:hypothetical protein
VVFQVKDIRYQEVKCELRIREGGGGGRPERTLDRLFWGFEFQSRESLYVCVSSAYSRGEVRHTIAMRRRCDGTTGVADGVIESNLGAG